MNELKGACIIGQSGGPTSVINASAFGVIDAALKNPNITNVYGAEHGIVGVLNDRLFDMSQEDPAELELLKNASEFQPELYRQIRQLATRQQVEQMREYQLEQLREISNQTLREVNRTLQQDGSVREQNFSRVSTMLSDSREEWQEMMDRFEIMLWKLLIFTAVASVALSVLVCMVLRHWLG